MDGAENERPTCNRWVEEGFLLDFSEFETPGLRSLAVGFIHLSSELWAFMERPHLAGQPNRARLTLSLIQSAGAYLEEMSRSLAGEAYFAGSVIGCSALEALLMMACLRDREAALQTKTWRSFAKRNRKRGKLFVELLPWVEIGTLLAIGEELDWFRDDDRVQRIFAELEYWEEALTEQPGLATKPLEAARQLIESRNLLHPGRIFRSKVRPTVESSKLSAALVYLSMSGILARQDAPPVLSLVLPVAQHLRPLVSSGYFGTAMAVSELALAQHLNEDEKQAALQAIVDAPD